MCLALLKLVFVKVIYFCLVKKLVWQNEKIKILHQHPESQSNALNTVSPEFPIPSFKKSSLSEIKTYFPLFTLYLTLCILFPPPWHLTPVYSLRPLPSHLQPPPPNHPHSAACSRWVFVPCLTPPQPLLPAEALTGMQKLCSSLCSNSVGSRNNDSRPTSPFRHHFLPHSQGKGPTPLLCAAPNMATHHVHRPLGNHFLSRLHLWLWIHDSHRHPERSNPWALVLNPFITGTISLQTIMACSPSSDSSSGWRHSFRLGFAALHAHKG